MVNLYRGSNYSAGELGYVVTDRQHVKGIQHVFEGYGYLESVASGSSISHELSSRLGKAVTAKEAFHLYQQGDADEVSVIDFALENLEIGIASFASLFDLEINIFGGGVRESITVISEHIRNNIGTHKPTSCSN